MKKMKLTLKNSKTRPLLFFLILQNQNVHLSLSLSPPRFSPPQQHTSTSKTPTILSQLQTKNHFTFPLFKIKSQYLSPQSTRHHSLYSLSTPNPNSQCPAVASPPTQHRRHHKFWRNQPFSRQKIPKIFSF